MSGFVAKDAVSPLDWDFTAFCGKGAKGTIPEPTQPAVDKFNRTMSDIFPDGIGVGLQKLDADEIETKNVLFKDAIAELSQGEPSRELLDKVPARVLTAFIGWLYGSLVNPK